MSQHIIQILVPYDFTEVAAMAARQACMLKSALPVEVTLLHVIASERVPTRLDELIFHARELSKELGPVVKAKEQIGLVLPTLEKEASNGTYTLMVAGTHGPHGLRQFLFGADILSLVKHCSCPSIVLQHQSVPRNRISRILLPIGAHDQYIRLVEQVGGLAKAFSAEVVIYAVRRPMESLSPDAARNTEKAQKFLRTIGVEFQSVEEELKMVSFGFARQTLEYANDNHFDLVAIMPHSSHQYGFMADAEKERMLTNEYGIAILCAGIQES